MKKLNFNLLDKDIHISQTFVSLEGEGQNIGEPSIYVRVAGCYSAACKFCDTKFSWYNKKKFKKVNSDWYMDLLNQVENINQPINRLTITGGEPLHYTKSLYKIVKVLQNIGSYKINIEWLGIESNGNLLADKNIVFELIRSFKHIQDEFKVKPTLTISPKLEAKTCYEGQLSQVQVIEMYNTVYENIKNYFPYEVNYKFVWEVSPKSNKLVLESLDELDKLKVKPKNIFLMPFTPKDPLGKNKDIWEKIKDITAKDALKFGIRYSPRIHIDRKLD